MSFQTHKSFVRLWNIIQDILDENREACDCPLDCQVNNTVKAQKSMKDRQNSPSAISGSIWTLWSDENTFCTQRKQK